MNAVSLTADQLRVQPSTLYASRGGASVFVERLKEEPDHWLRGHGVNALPESIPVIVMLDSSVSRGEADPEWCDVVALEYGDEQPLLHIEQAIAALEMTHQALVAAGHEDFVPSR